MVFLTLPFALDGLSELRVKSGDIQGLCEHDGAFVTEGETEPRIVPEYLRTARHRKRPRRGSLAWRNTGDTRTEQGRRPRSQPMPPQAPDVATYAPTSYSRPSTTAVHA
jgi:hypothetical protein